jgi:hydrogenase maturation protein HypF
MNRERIKVVIQGAVQGVGFRPFVHRLATGLGLKGWATNSAQGVLIEAEGSRNALNQFLLRLEVEKPSRAIIQSLEFSFLEPIGLAEFKILVSEDRGAKSAFILPDLAPCADCLREIFDPVNRRYLYPFTNCTNCGPRFSIIEALPYDRPHTSMKKFRMCDECLREYEDPSNRRFHAQPNSCCACGPQIELWDQQGNRLAEREEAWKFAAESVRRGMIVALKGVGGFQLIVDARNEDAVRRLRQRKAREEKPLAVMYPTLAQLREDCVVNDFEARLLGAAEAPIVLLSRNTNTSRLAKAVAPGNPNLGAMMPSSPLHHILLRELNFPVVATSGNLSNEPICIDENEALNRLGNIADVFLIHDRPIVRQLDDSVLRIIDNREMMLRRARGYAPLPISCRDAMPSILAVGGHLKNTVAFSHGREIFVSQHVGDLETVEAYAAFQKVAADCQSFTTARRK